MKTDTLPTTSPLHGLTEAIRGDPDLGPRLAAFEALDREIDEVLEAVDLDIAFSPVVMHGYDISNKVEVDYLGQDGKYYIRTGPQTFEKVASEDLKRMRARYLLLHGKAAQPMIDRFLRRQS